jgi:hypothetical protein
MSLFFYEATFFICVAKTIVNRGKYLLSCIINFFMIWRSIKKYFLVIAGFSILSACDNDTEQQLTKEEVVSFAKEIETAIKKGEGDFLDKAFDKDEFIKKMDLPATETAKDFARGVAQKITIGKQIANELGDYDNFEFIKHYVKDNRHHVIFRLFTDKEGSLNYQDYELIKLRGKCRVADMYIYMSGETLSETTRNMYVSLFPATTGETGLSETEKITDLSRVKDIRKLMHSGKEQEAKKIYDDLPDYIKHTKTVSVLSVLLASRLTLEEYSRALKDFKERFPNEPSMPLMMIDGYYLQKDYAGVLSAINSLDSQINKDPLLDYHRYLSYELLQDTSNSMICLRRLVKNLPDFQKGMIELIAVDLKNGDSASANTLIALYRKRPKFDQAKLDNIISYYQ